MSNTKKRLVSKGIKHKMGHWPWHHVALSTGNAGTSTRCCWMSRRHKTRVRYKEKTMHHFMW